MSKTITVSDETYKKIKKQVLDDNKVAEKEEKKFEIKSRFTGDVIYSSSKTTYKDTLEEAVGKDAYLKDAYLNGANLEGADLNGANLKGADFFHTNFYGIGGNTKIKKEQINDFLTALGVVAEN